MNMPYERTYSQLQATSLAPEQHERTCGYWYTVTNGAMAHTAFATRNGLDRWLCERGLALKTDLPEQATWGSTPISGEYRERSYLGDEDVAEFGEIRATLVTEVMSNGDYTLGLITEDAGVRTVHYLNPNVRTRPVHDYRASRAVMS